VARLTHLTAEKDAKAVRRNGIKPAGVAEGLTGVYAMPVLPDFFASHQWLRELRRHRASPLVAVDFVVPDDEAVLAGHYSREHIATTVAEAARVIMKAEDPRGYEVIVPRKIEAEIRRIRAVPQVVGWRYWPDAHGVRPCPCDICQRGLYGAAAVRDG
jgi:hypothetical protein